jgi:hypothetical protein
LEKSKINRNDKICGALGLGSPTKVEIERQDPPGDGFIPMGSVVTYHFPARGKDGVSLRPSWIST